MSGSIGPYTFALLTGTVGKLTQEIEVIEKPGEDGCIRRDRGQKCPVFTLESVGFYSNKTAAEIAFGTFEDMKTAGPSSGAPVDLVKDGFNYNTDAAAGKKIQVAVLQVIELDNRQKSRIVGTTHTWELRTEWTLLGVPV